MGDGFISLVKLNVFVNFPISIEHIVLAIYFPETTDNVKVKLRSPCAEFVKISKVPPQCDSCLEIILPSTCQYGKYNIILSPIQVFIVRKCVFR